LLLLPLIRLCSEYNGAFPNLLRLLYNGNGTDGDLNKYGKEP